MGLAIEPIGKRPPALRELSENFDEFGALGGFSQASSPNNYPIKLKLGSLANCDTLVPISLSSL